MGYIYIRAYGIIVNSEEVNVEKINKCRILRVKYYGKYFIKHIKYLNMRDRRHTANSVYKR